MRVASITREGKFRRQNLSETNFKETYSYELFSDKIMLHPESCIHRKRLITAGRIGPIKVFHLLLT